MDEPPDDQPLRVVVDPNVLVSAAIANGVSRRLVDLAAVGVIRLIACPRLLAELEGVLSRDRFLRWRTRDQLDNFVAGVELIVEMLPDPVNIPPATRDPDEDYLVALALAARVGLLCTGDKDFDDVREVQTMTPGDLVALLIGP